MSAVPLVLQGSYCCGCVRNDLPKCRMRHSCSVEVVCQCYMLRHTLSVSAGISPCLSQPILLCLLSRRRARVQERQFSLCDFGSAGGTFVRLGSGVPTPLFPGMMIMLGKHQVWDLFIV